MADPKFPAQRALRMAEGRFNLTTEAGMLSHLASQAEAYAASGDAIRYGVVMRSISERIKALQPVAQIIDEELK